MRLIAAIALSAAEILSRLFLSRLFDLTAFATPAAAGVSSFDFRLIVDNSTKVPGRTGRFASLSLAGIDNGEVAFYGVSSTHPGEQGVYLATDSGIEVVADTSTPI